MPDPETGYTSGMNTYQDWGPTAPATTELQLGDLPTTTVPVVERAAPGEPDRIDAMLDAGLELTRQRTRALGDWLRDADHRLLALTALMAAGFLLLVALAG